MTWLLVFASLAYVIFLFAIATWGDRLGSWANKISHQANDLLHVIGHLLHLLDLLWRCG